jgi:hypothetical protein
MRNGRFHWPMADGGIPAQDPKLSEFRNAVANAAREKDPDMQAEIGLNLAPTGELKPFEGCPLMTGPVTTMAEALEALHQATDRDIIADSFANLIAVNAPAIQGLRKPRVFDALNLLADARAMRWTKREGWLTFRTLEYYKARPQEVPNRLLERWRDMAKKEGAMSPQVLAGIASLTELQLDNAWNTAVARALYGLTAWDTITHEQLRDHWRLFGSLPARLRHAALTEKGVSYAVLPSKCRPQFVALAFHEPPASNDPALKGATFRVQIDASKAAEPSAVKFLYLYRKPFQDQWLGRVYTHRSLRTLEPGDKR